MIRAAALFIWLAGGALAESARVLSGEHADFTRLVIELPGAADWDLGRTAMGYAFRLGSKDQPDYDLTRVWSRIPRTRLRSLRADPVSGALLLGLACDCHVLAFDYRPGTVVLDIRASAAPAGSPFEAPLAQGTAAPPLPVPDPLVYHWRALDPARGSAAGPPLPLATGGTSLDPLREALLAQIARGAADGVVDMALPGKPSPPQDPLAPAPDWARVGPGPLPGLVIDGMPAPEAGAAMACLPDADLALGDWGGGRPPLDLLAEARDGLYGEFDLPSPTAVLRGVRLHLYLGFGAEARQYAGLVPPDARLDILLSLSSLVEGEPDPEGPFAGMLGCDGAAALWAALALRPLPPGSRANTDAIVRAYLALPPHLRRHLGPDLAEAVLPLDAAAARIVRDAMARAPDMAVAEVALADARADLQAGRPDRARGHAETAVTAGHPGAEALVALVEAHLRDLTPLAPDRADALAALSMDAEGGSADLRLQRAVALAFALSGQADRALANGASARPEVAGDLWRVLAALAEDDPFLTHAIGAAAGPLPPVSADVGAAVAARLVALGFPEAGLAWLGPTGPSDPPERRLLAARAELARGGDRAALALLAGLEMAEAQALRRRAQDRPGAAEGSLPFAEGGGPGEAAARRAAADDPAWNAAVAAAQLSAPRPDTPLARGAAALVASAAARDAIAALLAAVPSPDP